MKKNAKRLAESTLSIVLALILLITGCSKPGSTQNGAAGSSETASPAETSAMGTGGNAVGFIFVGTKDDYGYNQAAYIGSQAVEKAFPDLKVLRAENVPETAEAERVMEQMIKDGAKVIFPTSYGHLEPALNVAKRHPTPIFSHNTELTRTPKASASDAVTISR